MRQRLQPGPRQEPLECELERGALVGCYVVSEVCWGMLEVLRDA